MPIRASAESVDICSRHFNDELQTPTSSEKAGRKEERDHNSFFPEIAALLQHAFSRTEELISLAYPASQQLNGKAATSLHNASVDAEEAQHAAQQAKGHGPRSPGKAYTRSTMAGPDWIEESESVPNKQSTPGHVHVIAVRCSPGDGPPLPSTAGSTSGHAHPEGEDWHDGHTTTSAAELPMMARNAGRSGEDIATQQALKNHQTEHVERYLQRLAGAPAMEGTAQRSPNPFNLECSDDDDQPVMDRHAVKHRSYKIVRSTQPKNGSKMDGTCTRFI